MSQLGLYSKERDKATTEWDDIQRRLGNLPPLADGEASRCRDQEAIEAGTGATPAAVPATEDEDEELEQLRARRLRELKERLRFGNIVEIDHAGFVPEVNRAGDGVGVVVLLHKRGHYAATYMLTLLEKLAVKFKHVKFVRIGHTECIPGYPERNLPTLLVYKSDELLRQIVGTAAYGGASYGIDDVEWELARAGLVQTELEKNPHAQPHR